MKPSLGRIVIFKLSQEIKNAYGITLESCEEERVAIIVKCFSNEENSPVNLYVLDEGKSYQQHNFYINNIMQGTGLGQYHEPPRV